MTANWTGRCFLCIALILAFACSANAQPASGASGVRGDLIPDLYYFAAEGSVLTSFGTITRPAGTMVLDTDNCADCGTPVFDVIATLISGPDVSDPPTVPGGPGCDICDGSNEVGFWRLPTGSPTSSPVAGGVQTVGYAGNATQWLRTSPLTGLGFRGVTGTGWVRTVSGNPVVVNGWPADYLDPDGDPANNVFYGIYKQGLARYAAGLTQADFPGIYSDGTSEALWSVQLARDNGQTLLTNVTIIPEPTSGLLSILGLAAMSFLRRR